MQCQSCGNENQDSAKFCISCGTPLNKQPAEIASTVGSSESTSDVVSAPSYEQVAPDKQYEDLSSFGGSQPQQPFTPASGPYSAEQFSSGAQPEQQAYQSQQPGYQQQPYSPAQQAYAQTQQPKKSKTLKIVLIVVGVLLLLCIIGSIVTCSIFRSVLKSDEVQSAINEAQSELQSLENLSINTNTNSSSSSTTAPFYSLAEVEGTYDAGFFFETTNGSNPEVYCSVTLTRLSETSAKLEIEPYAYYEDGEEADVSECKSFSGTCSYDKNTLAFDYDIFGSGTTTHYEFEFEDDEDYLLVALYIAEDPAALGYTDSYGMFVLAEE